MLSTNIHSVKESSDILDGAMSIEQDWWKNRLAEDIYATLRMKEQGLQLYHGHSPQLWMRRLLVDWLCVLTEQLNICATAQHLAVYLLDYFLDGLEVECGHLYLLAATCFILAVKFEEHGEQLPRFSTLCRLIPQSSGCIPPGSSMNPTPLSYTPDQYLAMELAVLQYFDWDLTVPAMPHFVPYFLQVAVDEDDLMNGFPITSKPLVESYLEKHTLYFQEVCLQDPCFRQFAPSLLAASCVASSRICLHLTPTWPKQLELMTDYYLEELLPCVHLLLKNLRSHDQFSNKTLPVPASPSFKMPSGYLPYPEVQHNYFPYDEKSVVTYSSSVINYDSPVVYSVGPKIIPWYRLS